MAENTTIKKLRDLYQKCKDQPALASQILYAARLQNEVDQMDKQLFYMYESLLFKKAMKIFIQHFQEQVLNVLKLDEDTGLTEEQIVFEKHDQIADIQNAVSKMAEIFQSMAGSIKNIEQPIFPVLSGNMYVFNASLKMITAYSQLLNNMTEILEYGDQYAFLLYPAMTDIIYTDVLLKKRNRNGKVVVVTFPEHLTDHPRVIPILFHEAFHVIERNVRNRKLRASCFLENIICLLKELLFQDITFSSENLSTDNKIKDILINKWLDPAITRFLDWKNGCEETDRELYSSNLVEKTGQYFMDVLADLDTKIYEDLEEVWIKETDLKDHYDFLAYCCIAEDLRQQTMMIKSNLLNIIANKLLYVFGNTYITIYREGYADIASCLFLQLSAEQYDEAFQISCLFSPGENYSDKERLIRQYVVSASIECITRNGKQRQAWKKRAEECLQQIKAPTAGQPVVFGGIQRAEWSKPAVALIGNAVLGTYLQYFFHVAENLQDYFQKFPSLEAFRKFVNNMIHAKDEAMRDIFLGEVELT